MAEPAMTAEEWAIEGMAVRCDHCRRSFQVENQERSTDDGGVEVYFACPHCEAEYRAARISPRGVEIKDEIREARRQGWGRSTNRRFKGLLNALKKEVSRG